MKDLKGLFIGINKKMILERSEAGTNGDPKGMVELLDSGYQRVKRLLVFAYNNTAGNNQFSVNFYRTYFLQRVSIENYNIEIDWRNFFEQPVNDLIKQYDEVRIVSAGQGDVYATGCLLDFAYFEKSYRLMAVD